MKKIKNKKLLIGILFTLFVAVSFCIPKVEKVSAADTCDDGTIVDYYFLFSEGLEQSSTSPTITTTRYKEFIIKYESQLAFDELDPIKDGELIEVVDNPTTSAQWSKLDFWTIYERLTAVDGSPGYNYYRNGNKVYASAVKWTNSDTDTEVHTGVIVSGFTPQKATDATVTATGITTITKPSFYPAENAFRDGKYSISFGVTRNYGGANPAINTSNCPVNVRYNADGTTETIPEAQSHYCYHNAVQHYSFCGTNNGDPTPEESQSTSPTQPEYYRLHYNGNARDAINVPTDQQALTDQTITVLGRDGAPSREGYTFKGWALTSTSTDIAYNAGDTYRFTGVYDRTLYAVWEKQVGNYTLIYDANGGDNPPASVTNPTDEPITISDDEPTRDGYIFIGWAETPTATSKNSNFDAGKEYGFDGVTTEKTIYAVWVKEESDYILRYDPNGGQGAPEPQISQYGNCISISKQKPTFEGLEFLGWSTDKNAVEPDATYAAGKEYCGELGPDATLYAVWQTSTGVKDYALLATIVTLAAGAGLLIIKRTNMFKQI